MHQKIKNCNISLIQCPNNFIWIKYVLQFPLTGLAFRILISIYFLGLNPPRADV